MRTFRAALRAGQHHRLLRGEQAVDQVDAFLHRVRAVRDDDAGEIRAVYLTQHVPSMYRPLAARALLNEPSSAIGPFLAGEAGKELGVAVCAAAAAQALRFPELACFGAESARAVLDQFRRALPRNLVFAPAAWAR